MAIVAATPLWPLHQKRRIKRIIMSTYQAASGAGAAAMEELSESTRAHLEGRAFTPKVLPHPYAFNVFSHNTKVDPETGYNEEETKVMQETRKIFGEPDLRVTATCVRVPVLARTLHRAEHRARRSRCRSPKRARSCRNAPGVRVVDDMERNYFPMPRGRQRQGRSAGRAHPQGCQRSHGRDAGAVRRRRSAAQGRGVECGSDRGTSAGLRRRIGWIEIVSEAAVMMKHELVVERS